MIANTEFVITEEDSAFDVYSPLVELSSNSVMGLPFAITLVKQPTQISEGLSLSEVLFDRGNPQVANALEQTNQLRRLPLDKRPRALMEFLRSQVAYPYQWELEKLSLADPAKAEWVRRNLIEKDSDGQTPKVRFSDILKQGFGECRHISASYAFLASEANLTVAYETSSGTGVVGGDLDPLINVLRKDNNLPLFKSVGVGEKVWAGHAWVEVLSNQGWMPVDPVTKLVGDNPDSLKTFFQANYLAGITVNALKFDDQIKGLDFFGYSNLSIPVGAKSKTGTIFVGMHEVMGIPTYHKGPLNFRARTVPNFDGVNVKVTSVRSRF